jgi:hypothetical protein
LILVQQMQEFSVELNCKNFAESITKNYGRKSEIFGGGKPLPAPPPNREPWIEIVGREDFINLEEIENIKHSMKDNRFRSMSSYRTFT